MSQKLVVSFLVSNFFLVNVFSLISIFLVLLVKALMVVMAAKIPTLSFGGGTIFYDAATSYMSLHHQLGFTSNETVCSVLTFEREAEVVNVTVKGYNTDNGIYTAKELTVKLQESNQTIRMSGVGSHHQNGAAETAIKNISHRARIFMFHAALRWSE